MRAEGEAKGRAEGELAALRSNLLAVLEARRLLVDETLRRRIAECREPDRLRRWHLAAVTAASTSEALAG